MPIIVTNNFPPTRGGIQTMMLQLAEGFTERGLPVAVVAPDGPDVSATDCRLPYRVARYRTFRRPFELIAVIITTLKVRRVGSKEASIASAWWPTGLALSILPVSLRGPLVVLAHGTEIAPRRGGFRRWAMRFTFKRAAITIANSRYTAKLLATCGIKESLFVVPLGVSAKRIHPNRAENPTILSVGRLVARKGFDRVLQSLPALVDEFPKLTYEIVGDGPQRVELENIAHALHVADHVRFLGRASDTELCEAYARAWCFALPVRNIDDDVEGFGLVYLEAAMAELPTVGGRDSGAIDAIDDGVTGILVDGNDVSMVTAALLRLLRDSTEAQEMGRRGRERAETHFLWHRTVDRFIELLPKSA